MATPTPLLTGLAPVLAADTRILVLGSLPGAASLAAQQYYAHPRNQLWKLISEVIGQDLVALDYETRLQTLLRSGVGLWDVVAQAHRLGSLDSHIRNRRDNDLRALLARFPAIHTLAFNGATAARVGAKVLGEHAQRYRIVELPSSSPAHTQPYFEKLARWSTLRQALAGER